MSQSIPGNGKVRLALMGAGGISRAHVRAYHAQADKIECVALCDTSEENLKQRREQLGGDPALFSDWRQMLDEFGDHIDAVDIALPHHLHAPAILDAAAAKKHILCEKPMCMTLSEADAIQAAVSEANVIYMSAHNQLFDPIIKEAKRLIDSGAIGTVRWLRTQDCFVNSRDGLKGTWRADLKRQGGGELIDTGYHPSYLLLYFADAPLVAVNSVMGRYHMDVEGEDTASVQVLFENGVLGEMLTSWAIKNPHGTHQIHVTGDKGEIFGSQNELYYLPSGFTEPAKLTLPKIESNITEEMGHFADCVLTGQRPIHSVKEGREVLDLILRATESAQGWQRVAAKGYEQAPA